MLLFYLGSPLALTKIRMFLSRQREPVAAPSLAFQSYTNCMNVMQPKRLRASRLTGNEGMKVAFIAYRRCCVTSLVWDVLWWGESMDATGMRWHWWKRRVPPRPSLLTSCLSRGVCYPVDHLTQNSTSISKLWHLQHKNHFIVCSEYHTIKT